MTDLFILLVLVPSCCLLLLNFFLYPFTSSLFFVFSCCLLFFSLFKFCFWEALVLRKSSSYFSSKNLLQLNSEYSVTLCCPSLIIHHHKESTKRLLLEWIEGVVQVNPRRHHLAFLLIIGQHLTREESSLAEEGSLVRLSSFITLLPTRDLLVHLVLLLLGKKLAGL